MIIGKEFRFEASHILPYHLGKCHNLHGHSYVLIVELKGPIKWQNGDPDSGMVVDFAEMKPIKKMIDQQLDHKHLNDLIENPTAELIAMWIASWIQNETTLGEMLHSVTLYETATCYARIEIPR